MTTKNYFKVSPTDPRVLDKVAHRLLADLRAEYPGEFDFADPEREAETIKSLIDNVRYEQDGYKLCRNLENDGWDPDYPMVELMERSSRYMFEAVKELSEAEEAASVTP